MNSNIRVFVYQKGGDQGAEGAGRSAGARVSRSLGRQTHLAQGRAALDGQVTSPSYTPATYTPARHSVTSTFSD